MVLHGRDVDRHLLPAELPAITPKRANVRFYRRRPRRSSPASGPASGAATPHRDPRSGTCAPMSWAGPCASSPTASSTATASAAGRAPRLQRAAPPPPARRGGGAGDRAGQAQRAQTARVLIETTDLPFAQVVRSVPASPASGSSTTRCASLRHHADRAADQGRAAPAGRRHRVPARRREPCGSPAGAPALRRRRPARAFLGPRGARCRGGGRRHLPPDAPPSRPCRGRVDPGADHVGCAVRLSDLRDLASAVQRSAG